MGERIVKISPNQQISDVDLSNIGLFARSGLDHVVADAVESGKRYTGFNVVPSGPAQVTVGAGRLYDGGRVFFRDDAGGVVLDLISKLPAVTKKVVAVVVWGTEIDTAVQPRTFLVDVDTEQTEAQAVPTENRRNANIDSVASLEGTDPSPPSTDANVLVVAHVVLTSAGVESVTMVAENRLTSVRDNRTSIADISAWRSRAGAQLDTLSTSVAGIQEELRGLPSADLVLETARDVANLKELSEQPESFTSYAADRFLTDALSDTGHVDFLAKVEEGIRFPPANQRVAQLALVNVIDPTVDVRSNFVLPKFTEVARVKIDGRDGELSVAQYPFQTTEVVQKSRSRTRIRYGSSKTVCTNGAWWRSGRYDPVTNIFRRGGETWEVAANDIDDALKNHRNLRVTQFWEDTYAENYWESVTVTETFGGAIVGQTFLNSEPGYITGISLPFTRVAATGDVHLVVVETESGAPVIGKAIARVTVPVADLKVFPTLTKIPLVPTYLEKGRRYGILVISAGNHFLATVEGNKNAQGSLFYSTDGAFVVGDLVKDIPFTLHYAQFITPRLEVALQPLQLENGIADIDVNFDTTSPSGTEISLEVQVGGKWLALKRYAESILVGLPPLLQLRAVLLGTTDVMPGFGIGPLSEALTERPRSDYRHISAARVLPAPCDTVEVTVRLEYWNPARHACTMTLLTGGAYTTVETPDTVVDKPTPDVNAIERVFTFNTAAPISTFKIKTEGTTNNVLVVYHVAVRSDISYS